MGSAQPLLLGMGYTRLRHVVADDHLPALANSEEAHAMEKKIECAKVDPTSGCAHTVRGKDEQEVLKNAMEHAKTHGIRQVTPELMAAAKAAIRDAE
jgi:predicted small metal-binding protein